MRADCYALEEAEIEETNHSTACYHHELTQFDIQAGDRNRKKIQIVTNACVHLDSEDARLASCSDGIVFHCLELGHRSNYPMLGVDSDRIAEACPLVGPKKTH